MSADPTGDGPPRRGFFRRSGKWLLLLLPVAAVGLFLVLRQTAGGAIGNLDKALVATVRRADLEVTVLETGRVEPRLQAQVKGRVGGQVIEVTVQEGEQVKKGQLLVRVEPNDYKRDVARVEADIAQQRQMLTFAELQLARAERARAVQVSPAAELDQARHEAAMGKARLAAGQVALATARDRLRYTLIESPFDGTVIQRNIQPGEAVVPGVTSTFEGKPLLVIADLSTLLVKIDLNQIDVAKVRMGQRAELSLDALPGKKYTATVTRVAAAAATTAKGASSGPDAFPVEATLEARQDLSEIKPGMTADVRVLIETRKGVLLLPIEALVNERGRSFVSRIEAGAGPPRTTLRDVTVGARNDRDVEISAGLTEGERVMIKPPAASEIKM